MKLEEFDEEKEAVFNPWNVVKKIENCPKTLVTCFAHNLVEYALEQFEYEKIGACFSANGQTPIYCLKVQGERIGLTMSMVGAAGVTGQYEELFAMGFEQIVVFGTCGVLAKEIEDCSIIIPETAVREEGTSFHYAAPSDEIAVNIKTKKQMQDFFEERGIHYIIGKCWTTDAIYRETRAKVERRKAEGCICVDMECSAIAALAAFRQKQVAQFFYAADNLDAEEWDARSLGNASKLDIKGKIVELAIELAIKLK